MNTARMLCLSVHVDAAGASRARPVARWLAVAALLVAGLTASSASWAQAQCTLFLSYGGIPTSTLAEACEMSSIQLGFLNSRGFPAGYVYVYDLGGPVLPSSCAAGTVTLFGPGPPYPSEGAYPGIGIANTQVTCPQYWIGAHPIPFTDCQTCNRVSEPVNPATGAVFNREDDVAFAGAGGLSFTRYYDSTVPGSIAASAGWTYSYTRRVMPYTDNVQGGTWVPTDPLLSGLYSTASDACANGFVSIRSQIPEWASATANYDGSDCVVKDSNGVTLGKLPVFVNPLPPPPNTVPTGYQYFRDNGQLIRFPLPNGGVASSSPGTNYTLQETTAGLVVTTPDDTVEVYNLSGVLQSITSRSGVVQTVAHNADTTVSTVTDSFGHSLAFGYNAQSLLSSVTPSGGTAVQFGYDASNRFNMVTNADTTSRTYLYDDVNAPNSLSGMLWS